ncbi:MAG TPA: hypothetical protein VGH09_00615 [Solirubrobacteraceae bacterium]|jgi:hypothetical protein
MTWRRSIAAGALLAALAVVLAVALVTAGAVAAKPRAKAHRKPKPAGPLVTVAPDLGHPGPAIQPGFIGLSFEASALPQIARYSDRGDFVTMLRSLGPGELRFGGVSADTRIAWTDSRTPRPAWATNVVDADDLRELGALAAASGWHVVLTLGIVHYEPVAAAREAAAAKAALGPWLAGIEIGNEPNSYAQHAMREEPWTFAQYAEQVAAYRAAIEAAAPGIPLIGPDVSGSAAFEAWGPAEAVAERPAVLTGHHYPLGCAQQPPPSIVRLLSKRINAKEAASLHRYVAIANASATPFRLDETNSVSCGGVAGISDTFASALWAAGFLPQVMRAGAVGFDMHGNPARCDGYTPVCAPDADTLAEGALVAQPVWYALLMLRGLAGDRPLPASVGLSSRSINVRVAAFADPKGGLEFVLVDDDPPGARAVTVRLRVGARIARASVLSLNGESPTVLSGVSLGGREVATDGHWTAGRLPTVGVRAGVATLQLAPSSAALVRVAPG